MKYISYLLNSIKKKITIGLVAKSGRNFSGKICVHHRKGLTAKKYYKIDFYRRINSYGYIFKIIYSAHRTSYIGGIIYENGLISYIILSEKVELGSRIYSGVTINETISEGWTNEIKNINLFTIINNIEILPYEGAKLVRAAGTGALLTTIEKNKINLKLKSGWNIKLINSCLATLGNVSNMKHKFDVIGKAGKAWALGKRPKVRGVAMNPCDHPHGGGEGKKSSPAAPRSRWGWLTKGTPSLKKKYEKKKKLLYKKIKK